jgi:hypothetical protein
VYDLLKDKQNVEVREFRGRSGGRFSPNTLGVITA